MPQVVGSLGVVPVADLLRGNAGPITGTGDTAVIAAQGAGIRTYVVSVVITNSHATVGTWVHLKDGTTTIWSAYAAPGGGGVAINFGMAPLRLTANAILNAANATTGSSTQVAVTGYKATD